MGAKHNALHIYGVERRGSVVPWWGLTPNSASCKLHGTISNVIMIHQYGESYNFCQNYYYHYYYSPPQFDPTRTKLGG